MNLLANIAGVLLGLLFLMAGGTFFFAELPLPPEGTPARQFFDLFVSTGYLHMVKVLELIGAVLVAVPRTRNLGLLVLGPILVNILAFHVFITAGEGLTNPMLWIPCVLALLLMWCERRAFSGLVERPARTAPSPAAE